MKEVNKIILILLLTLMIFVCSSCKKNDSSIPFEGESRLLSYLETQVGLNSNNKKSIIFLLQNASCICTEENIAFANSIAASEKYSDYTKVVVVGKKDHDAIESLQDMTKIHVDAEMSLAKHGLSYYRDKFFEIENSKVKYWSDVYDETLQDLETKYLFN